MPCLFASKKVQKKIAQKGVQITLFQSNLKNFSNRLLIHFFQPILLCFDTFLYAKKAGHFRNDIRIGVSLLVLTL